MANIDNGFRVETLSIDDNVLVTSGSLAPNTGAGYEAPQGSLYLKTDGGTNGQLYVKFGPADVDWQLQGAASSSPVFGSEYQVASSPGVTTTTSTSFLSKVTLTTPSLPAGTYRISVRYGWNHNSTGNDFEARLMENGVIVGRIHKQEPKDSSGSFSTTGTSQRHYTNQVHTHPLAGGVYTYDLQFRTDSSGTSSSMWQADLEIWRVL